MIEHHIVCSDPSIKVSADSMQIGEIGEILEYKFEGSYSEGSYSYVGKYIMRTYAGFVLLNDPSKTWTVPVVSSQAYEEKITGKIFYDNMKVKLVMPGTKLEITVGVADMADKDIRYQTATKICRFMC